MKNTIRKFMVLGMLVLVFASCKKKDDPKPSDPQNPNEEELITTLKLILTEDGTNNITAFQFEDLDGPGGNPPVQDNIVLTAGKLYHGKIVLLDKTKSPIDSISNEVLEERDAHQFFYTTTGVNISNTYVDFDSHGVPVGLLPEITTGTASSGTLKVTLKHQPGVKPTSGMGDINQGETDVEVIFNVTIN